MVIMTMNLTLGTFYFRSCFACPLGVAVVPFKGLRTTFLQVHQNSNSAIKYHFI